MPGVVCTAAVSFLVVTRVYGSVSTPFAWINPVAGSVLSPDDLLNASWTSSQNIISPSFSLCASSSSAPTSESNSADSAGVVQNRRLTGSQASGDDTESVLEPASPTEDPSDDCGDAVWPNVSLDPTSGEHTAQLSIPQLSAPSSFYLLMKSDLGNTYQSPVFDIASDLDPTEAGSTAIPTTASGPAPGTTPGSPSQPTPSSPETSGGPIRKPLPIGPIVPPNPPNYVPPPASSALPPTRSISPADAAANAANKSRRMLAVAMAVPLSLVAFAALAAAAACLVIRRQKLNNQSSGSAPSFVPSSRYSATSDSFTALPQRTCNLSKSTIMSEKLACATASSSEYLVQPLHQYQPYFTTSYAPYPGPYPFLPQHHVATGRPLYQSEPIPIHSMSNAPVLYPTQQTPIRPPIPYQPASGIIRGAPFSGPQQFQNIQAPINPTARSAIITPTLSPSNFTAPTQSREAVSAPGSVIHPPSVLMPGGQGNQFGSPQGSFDTGTATQLTPPATDSTSLRHMTMQNILNSYMARQADMEYRDSKPMPAIPFEPVDLDAGRERELK